MWRMDSRLIAYTVTAKQINIQSNGSHRLHSCVGVMVSINAFQALDSGSIPEHSISNCVSFFSPSFKDNKIPVLSSVFIYFIFVKFPKLQPLPSGVIEISLFTAYIGRRMGGDCCHQLNAILQYLHIHRNTASSWDGVVD